MMHRRLLPVAIGFALSSTGWAQTGAAPGTTPPPQEDGTIPVTYVGSNARVSLGIDDDGDVLGEILAILGKDEDSAWLGQLWLGDGGAGGVQVGYHWLHGEAGTEREPGDASVLKAFGAFDQNAWKDRKATLGLGWEKKDFSVDAYLMHATTGARATGTESFTDTIVHEGSDANGPYTQVETIETLVERFEHPYDNGVGVRFGRYFDQPLLRVRGGLDYERGDYSSSQWTLSLGIDKYFANTGFSLSLLGEKLRKKGDFEIDRNDTRGWLLLRYDIGQNYRAREPYRMVEVERSVADPAPPAQPQVIRNEVRLDGDAFFDFDHADLRPDAVAALDELIAKLAGSERVSRVTVVGHTDSVGTVAYNQKLSERRAESAKRYLVEHGIPADQIDARGEGELNPSFPNDTRENRQKNRRVDIEFLTIEETTVPAPEPEPRTAVEWVREPVDVPPAWIDRALRNPAEHKRTVDVYRFEKATATSTLGPREYLNQPPVAVDDAAEVAADSHDNPIAVLANDSDPDGDALEVIAVSAAAHGTAVATAGGVAYTPAPGWLGTDSFTYTISDGRGGEASATVTVNVTTPNNPPVAIPLDVRVQKGGNIEIDVIAEAVTDPDGDPLTLISVEHTGPIPINTVSITSDNKVLFTSNHGWFGQDWFDYTVSDGRGGTVTGRVMVYVFELPPWG